MFRTSGPHLAAARENEVDGRLRAAVGVLAG